VAAAWYFAHRGTNGTNAIDEPEHWFKKPFSGPGLPGTEAVVPKWAEEGQRKQIDAAKASRKPITEKLNATIKVLSQEPPGQSRQLLSQVDLYYYPGVMFDSGFVIETPLSESVGQWDVDSIMSNRRFMKVLQELRAVERGEAGKLVDAELRKGLESYFTLMKGFMSGYASELAPDYKPKANEGGPGFQVSDNPDGTPTLMGARFKVLALVLLAGNLELMQCNALVRTVVDESLKQRNDAYTKHHKSNGLSVLRMVGLYNRQVLATGIVGTCGRPGRAKDAVGQCKLSWRQQDLPAYTAYATPYDRLTHDGPIPPDYSGGKFPVRYLGPMPDAQFDRLLGTLLRE
jgi:hypothetical protein